MTLQVSTYRQIMKATSLFGGVQLFQIVISVIKSKFVALLLGPDGMGVVGLLTSTTGLVSGLTGFGLGTSAVRQVSEAYATEDRDRLSIVAGVLRRLVWITGLAGALLTLLFSRWLSIFAFGNSDYRVPFIWISVTLLFSQLSSGEQVMLQALRRLRDLARVNLYASVSGLVISILLYYRLGMRGIVPVIIITAGLTLLFSIYYGSRSRTDKQPIPRALFYREGKKMMLLGFMISLSSIVSLAAAFLLRIFISHTGGLAEVGFYTAGFTIINTYAGMIFTAMATDYYPRLSAVSADDNMCREHVNQQAEVALLLLAPILILFLVFVEWAVILLYSSRFLVITGMLYWAALGIFFKGVSWAIAFLFLAKGEGKTFFWNELVGSSYMLLLNMLGYHLGGLTGLGFSFLFSYLFYLIQVYLIARIKFHFSCYTSLITLFVVQFLLALLSFAVIHYLNPPYSIVAGCLLAAVSIWYSYRELEKRMGIKEIVRSFFHKQHKK